MSGEFARGEESVMQGMYSCRAVLARLLRRFASGACAGSATCGALSFFCRRERGMRRRTCPGVSGECRRAAESVMQAERAIFRCIQRRRVRRDLCSCLSMLFPSRRIYKRLGEV